MTIKSKFTKIAVATSVAGALIVPASAAHAGDRTERAVIGALLGGVAGAVIAKDDATGAAIGAAAGAAIGVATDKNKHRRYSRSYRTQPAYASVRLLGPVPLRAALRAAPDLQPRLLRPIRLLPPLLGLTGRAVEGPAARGPFC
jgi:hypothetical protein